MRCFPRARKVLSGVVRGQGLCDTHGKMQQLIANCKVNSTKYFVIAVQGIFCQSISVLPRQAFPSATFTGLASALSFTFNSQHLYAIRINRDATPEHPPSTSSYFCSCSSLFRSCLYMPSLLHSCYHSLFPRSRLHRVSVPISAR